MPQPVPDPVERPWVLDRRGPRYMRNKQSKTSCRPGWGTQKTRDMGDVWTSETQWEPAGGLDNMLLQSQNRLMTCCYAM